MTAQPSKRRKSPAGGKKASAGRRPSETRPPAVGSSSANGAAEEPISVLDGNDHLRRGVKLDLADDKLRELFRGMLQIRLLDSRMLNLQRQGRIGFYGQCIGQEAAIIGTAAALEPSDWVVPALREAGVAAFRGLPLPRLIAQLMGKGTEVSQGRQMPCHHSYREGNFVSMSSVIATQLPHAVGIARAAQIRGDRCAVVGYMGDGATSENDFHCALNFAGVWKAPVVFVCQNNQWAISVPFARQTASASVAIKAGAYGMPGVRVDGNDVLATYLEMRKALDHVRAGRGPVLLEALTYRRMGHSSSDDPTRYRDEAEVEHWKKLDPLDRMRRFLHSRKLLTKAQEEEYEESIHQSISAAVTEAEAEPGPALESLVEDVFAEVTPQLASQRDRLLRYVQSQKEGQQG